MVTVLSKPACVQCTATKKWLEARGVEHTVKDMSVDDEALGLAKSLGHMSAPVVILPDGESFSGFRPDKLAGLVG